MSRVRHLIIWKLLRYPAYLFLKLRFRYTCEQAPKIPGPFLLVANHVTDLDPVMVGCSFSQQMYFVASEHLFRKGFISRLLVWLVAPIARIKGSTDTVSAMNILRSLRRRANVGLFAEGDRSWNGLTSELHPTTACLIKLPRQRS
jgi:1-acyl-sn-glycerol-3-phosphate acyltransferase